MTYRFEYTLMILGMLFLFSCSKENIDSSITEEGVFETSVVSCDLEVTIEHNDPGRLTLVVMGGTEPYSYEWSTGETTAEIQVDLNGDYDVTVTDAEGCIIFATINVVISDPCEGFSVMIDPNVQVDEVVLSAIVLGGTAPYVYEWSTGEITDQISVAEDGEYAVLVTDANGCSIAISIPVIVTDPCLGFDAQLGISGTSSLAVTVSGGTPPYIYTWSNGGFGNENQNLPPGDYTVTVTDSNGCTDVETITIDNDPCNELTALFNYDENIGNLSLETTGGTMPYTYLWSTGETTSSINVGSGIYEVTITDAVGCVAGLVIDIP